MHKIWIVVVAIGVLGLGVGYWLRIQSEKNVGNNPKVTVKAEVTPTITPMAKVEGNIYKDVVELVSPREGEQIDSPVTVEGRARGMWFFEATFPVIIVDWDGRIIGEGFAEAKGDWMTEEWVPFELVLAYEMPDFGEAGTLILRKANPSGLPENDDAFEVGIRFELSE